MYMLSISYFLCIVLLSFSHKCFLRVHPWPFQSLSLYMFLLPQPTHYERQDHGGWSETKQCTISKKKLSGLWVSSILRRMQTTASSWGKSKLSSSSIESFSVQSNFIHSKGKEGTVQLQAGSATPHNKKVTRNWIACIECQVFPFRNLCPNVSLD